MNKKNNQYMLEAFKLAAKGKNLVFPNPFVGAIVVKNGKIVGKGFHKQAGKEHAEVNALNDAGIKAKNADLYVTLEPCSTYGKTPPCTAKIIESKIKKVYIGALDYNPRHRKKAESILNKKGIETEILDFGEKNSELNKVFNFNIKYSLPYVHLKAAISLDGMICDSRQNSKWITCEKTRLYSHYLRAKCDAILVGSKTFNLDNPRLNIRNRSKTITKDPAVIIISASGKLNLKNNLLKNTTEREVLILTTPSGKRNLQGKINNHNTTIKSFSRRTHLSIKPCLTYLKKRGYTSILVEGGSSLLEQFLQTRLFQELHIFMAPKVFGKGSKNFSSNANIDFANKKNNLSLITSKKIENDIYLRYKNVYWDYSSIR